MLVGKIQIIGVVFAAGWDKEDWGGIVTKEKLVDIGEEVIMVIEDT